MPLAFDTRSPPPPPPQPVEDDPVLSPAEFQRLAAIVKAESGIHLNETKLSLVYSRLVKRLRLLGLRSFRQYCHLVDSEAGADERRRMIEALTTNHTFFLREPHHFEHLRTALMPELAERARNGARVRIWSAGCSAGHEPYSIAMSVLAALPEAPSLDVRILATDIDATMVAAGRAGVYEATAIEPVAPAERSRWFRPVEGGARFAVAPELRRIVSFRELNLFNDWPMRGDFDVVFCRNVMIYFDRPARETLWTRFANRLLPGGTLFIGHSERVEGAAVNLLTALPATTYRRNAR